MDLHGGFSEWSIDQIPGSDRTDAWQDVLSHNYREWQVPRRVPATFRAKVKQHSFAGVRIVETTCDSCTGRRTQGQVRRDGDLYVGVQLTVSGRERFKIEDSGVEVTSGDLVVWTTDQAVQFEVFGQLHKLTLMIPWSLIRERLPERKYLPLGGKIESRRGVGSLLVAHLLALSTQIENFDLGARAAVNRSTFELLSTALSQQQPSVTFDATAANLIHAQDFILQHLHDENLSPARIAMANNMSIRYLHLLFQRSAMTVSRYVLVRRLDACKQALTDPAFERLQISEIAFRWGFNSMSHFCRTFKEYYGASPRDVRHMAPGIAAGGDLSQGLRRSS